MLVNIGIVNDGSHGSRQYPDDKDGTTGYIVLILIDCPIIERELNYPLTLKPRH